MLKYKYEDMIKKDKKVLSDNGIDNTKNRINALSKQTNKPKKKKKKKPRTKLMRPIRPVAKNIAGAGTKDPNIEYSLDAAGLSALEATLATMGQTLPGP